MFADWWIQPPMVCICDRTVRALFASLKIGNMLRMDGRERFRVMFLARLIFSRPLREREREYCERDREWNRNLGLLARYIYSCSFPSSCAYHTVLLLMYDTLALLGNPPFATQPCILYYVGGTGLIHVAVFRTDQLPSLIMPSILVRAIYRNLRS